METRVNSITLVQCLFAHIKEVDKWRVHSQKTLRLQNKTMVINIQHKRLESYTSPVSKELGQCKKSLSSLTAALQGHSICRKYKVNNKYP